LAASGIRRSIVEIAVDVENVKVSCDAAEGLDCSGHNTAIATDQERKMTRLLQVARYTLADAIPGDPWAGPIPDRRDRVVRKIARDCNVTVVERLTAGGFEAREQLDVAVSLRIVLIAGVERSGSEGNAQDVIGPVCHCPSLTMALSKKARGAQFSGSGRQQLPSCRFDGVELCKAVLVHP
jgi:hypothetical protein